MVLPPAVAIAALLALLCLIAPVFATVDSSIDMHAAREASTAFPLLAPRALPDDEQLVEGPADFEEDLEEEPTGAPITVDPAVHAAEVEYFKLKKRDQEEHCQGKLGRNICGPLCGAWWVYPRPLLRSRNIYMLTQLIAGPSQNCLLLLSFCDSPEGECCRGTDMTCGKGPEFCEARCTPQFSLGTCNGRAPVNTLYSWWETDGPGGSSAGRILEPAEFNKVAKTTTTIKRQQLRQRATSVPELELPLPMLPRDIRLEPNAYLPLGAKCNVTPGTPAGLCQSSCCLNGTCTYCDKCNVNPKSSNTCKWCIRTNRTVSPEGCLLMGDKCSVPLGAGFNNRLSKCKTGCCKAGVCTYCENCMYRCKCGLMGYPLNPRGTCVTKTSTTTRTKTTSRTRTTTKPPPPPPVPQGGKGHGWTLVGCSSPGKVAMTFDDGPYQYTQDLLDLLDNRGVKATFFVNGFNWGNIFDRADLIRRMYNSGHCVGNHGWSHTSMPTLSRDAQLNNIVQLDNAIRSIIGVRTRYFRPPYGNINDATRSVVAQVGSDIALWNLDTNDWSVRNADVAFNAYTNTLNGRDPGSSSFISLEHDIFEETVHSMAPRAIDYIRSMGYQLVDMGTCQGSGSWDCYQ